MNIFDSRMLSGEEQDEGDDQLSMSQIFIVAIV